MNLTYLRASHLKNCDLTWITISPKKEFTVKKGQRFKASAILVRINVFEYLLRRSAVENWLLGSAFGMQQLRTESYQANMAELSQSIKYAIRLLRKNQHFSPGMTDGRYHLPTQNLC